MIQSFASEDVHQLFLRNSVRRIPANLQRVALRKLVMLDAATDLTDLRIPPADRLEKLKGNRDGWWSIRINDQWRVVFRWDQGNAHDVDIVDYH